MADVQRGGAPLDTRSSTGRQDSVFVVENTDVDLASLFASIDKKEPASPKESGAAEEPVESDPAPSKAVELPAAVAPKGEKTSKKRGLQLLLLGLTVAAAGLIGAHQLFFKHHAGTAARNPAQVRNTIVVPSTVERLEVFFTAQSREKEDLLLMTLAVHANRPNGEEILSGVRVAIRDVVYGFLTQQRPEKNARRSWAPIVEKELLSVLQRRFPQAGIVAVELEELQKI